MNKPTLIKKSCTRCHKVHLHSSNESICLTCCSEEFAKVYLDEGPMVAGQTSNNGW